MAATILQQFAAFDAASTEWNVYEEAFVNYLVANNIVAPQGTEADRRRALLVSSIGLKTLSLLTNLCLPDQVSDKTYDQIREILRNHYVPKKTTFASTNLFLGRRQKETENVADYAADLRKLASKCEFDNVDRRLLEQLTAGLRSDTARRKLIEKMDGLTAQNRTFAAAIDFVQKFETIERDVYGQSAGKANAHASTSASASANVSFVRRQQYVRGKQNRFQSAQYASG
jgi:hypothetical protein